MNKFNLGLHSALFERSSDSAESLKALDPVNLDIKSEVILPTKERLRGLETEVVSGTQKKVDDAMLKFDSEYFNFSNKVGKEIQQLRTERQTLTSERLEKVGVRHKGGNVLRWNESVRNGYEHLLTALTKKGYFANPKAESMEDIQEMYINAASQQYEQYVWDAKDEVFDGVKERLFTQRMGNDYPANKIYTKLTGAASIFAAEREYTEGYGVDVVLPTSESGEGNGEVETMSDRENRKFLSTDLPKYLYGITGSIPTWIKDLINTVTPVGIQQYKSSKVDRTAIEDFVKASTKIEVAGGKDPAVALLEALHDNRISTDTTKDIYKAILSDHGITLKKNRYLDDVVKAGNFYIMTQIAGSSEKNQHGLYLTVLKIIENEGGVANAVNKLKPIVEQANQEKEEEMASGEKLQSENGALYELAKQLGITDFTNATMLANIAKKHPNYFTNTSVERILANLNNDRSIDAGDTVAGGLKSGTQFVEIFNQIGKDKALHNLLEHAKLVNKGSSLGLDESKFTEAEIKGGNVELILLLQDIISKPGEDLFTLLSGKETENPFEGKNLSQIEKEGQAKEEAFKKAGEILSEEAFLDNYKKLFEGKDNVDIQSFADLQASLASCLYENYTKTTVGVGGTVSFDEWCKGLQFVKGARFTENGDILCGLGVSYSHTFALENGWTVTPGLFAGVFLPIVSGDADAFASVGLNVSLDKKKMEFSTGTVQHYGFDAGFNFIAGTAYLGWHHNRDRLEGIPEAAKFQSQKFEQVVMWKMLDRIKEELGDKKMDLNDPNVLNKVKGIVMNLVKEQEDIKEADREAVVNGMIRKLTNYNNADLNQPGVKYAIAKGVSEEYEMTWSEARKDAISKNLYRSGYSVGAFWLVGTPEFGVYATAQFTKHDVDGYGDKWGENYNLLSEEVGEWNETSLNRFNQQLGLSGKNRLKIEGGFVVIPSSLIHRVNVSDKMKGLMKKNENGDVLIDVHTPMAGCVRKGASIQGSEIMMGGNKGNSWEKLDKILPSWFASEIDQDAVLELGEAVDVYTAELLDKAINDLKKKFPAGDPIQSFEFHPSIANLLIEGLNKLDKSKIAKVVMTVDDQQVRHFDFKEGEEGKGLEIEYKATLELFNEKSKNIADAVYAEALKLRNPKVLNDVKHQPRREYAPFNAAMLNKDYITAREAIKPIFAKLDQQISGANFTEIGNNLDDITDINALGQALMSINNIFARSKKVRGGNGDYEFRGRDKEGKETPISMGSIIAEREGQISRTIEHYNGGNITPEAKDAYLSLIEASKKYREQNKEKFNKKSAPAAQLNNTVGFNLGDKTNPENPLFNPEIYDPMVDLKELENLGFDANKRSVLQERAMRLFVGNEALISPVLKYLGLEGKTVDVKEFKLDGERGKLTLDIGGKKVTLSAGMKFGYFTQCVNHTVILDDISAETEDGASVKFNSDVWEDGTYREGNKSTIVATTKVNVGLSVSLGGAEGGEENSATKTNDATTGGKGSGTNPNGTTETPTNPNTAGGGDTTVSGGDEF